MVAVMQGVRILEVAEHTFVPAASALLADWGAEVIKIEHVERGDAMRGLASSGVVDIPSNVHVLLEHSNRGKQSLALDLTSDDGLDILYRLAATSDVFLTNKLPSVRTKLQDRRRRHPRPQPATSSTCAAPARASADPTPTRAPTTRSRSGAAPASRSASSAPTTTTCPSPPGPGLRRLDRRHDDRRRDHGCAVPPRAHRRGDDRRRVAARHRPLGDGPGDRAVAAARTCRGRRRRPNGSGPTRSSRNYLTKDGRCLLVHLPAGREVLAAPVRGHRAAGARDRRALRRPRRRSWPTTSRPPKLLRDVFAERTLDEWRERLADFAGQWTVVQDTLEAAVDPQTVANGYVQDVRDRRRASRSSSSPRRCSSTRSRRRPGARPSSTSTATPSSPSSASTGTPSSTSRSAASSPDHHPLRPVQQPNTFAQLDQHINHPETGPIFHAGLTAGKKRGFTGGGPFAGDTTTKNHWANDWVNRRGNGGKYWPYLTDVDVRGQMTSTLGKSVAAGNQVRKAPQHVVDHAHRGACRSCPRRTGVEGQAARALQGRGRRERRRREPGDHDATAHVTSVRVSSRPRASRSG